MNGFISFAEHFKTLLPALVSSPSLHAKWLNTLSFLENCGARKIAACEHPTLVKEAMLRHAAEEFRHAHHLKRQMAKILSDPLADYTSTYILGGSSTVHYLLTLDLKTCRYLKERGLAKSAIKEAAYLLVTYAIELRAGELYFFYDQALRSISSQVTVRAIMLEEKEHLEEMQEGLRQLPLGLLYAEQVALFEGQLCQRWLESLAHTLNKENKDE